MEYHGLGCHQTSRVFFWISQDRTGESHQLHATLDFRRQWMLVELDGQMVPGWMWDVAQESFQKKGDPDRRKDQNRRIKRKDWKKILV